MPNILFHAKFAKEVFRLLEGKTSIDKVLFWSGNQIPDLATKKTKSHYSKSASREGFYVPDLEAAKRELFVPGDSVKLGMFSHLYLDTEFIEGFLIPEFIWDDENMQVINPRNNKKWDVKTFFSHDGMYGSYTEINQLILENGDVTMEELNSIPEILPDSGITVFDERREKTWKKELEGYLAQKKNYTGDIFDYDRFCKFVQKTAKRFVEEYFV